MLDTRTVLHPAFIPALVVLLTNAEGRKGSALTESEVLAIRDEANCFMLPPDAKEELDASRGYRDLDPDHCWREWLVVRHQAG